MGSSKSKFINQEKTRWIQNHSLNYEYQVAEEYRALVLKFLDGSDLQLCYEDKDQVGYPYQHWFVTDGTWMIEFASGDSLNYIVVVHAVLRRNYIISETFKMNNDVRNRMLQVCGASNYSLALRNCEHVARYIQSGVWVSFQMAKDSGYLFKIFRDYLSTHSKLINTFPKELEPSVPPCIQIYKGYNSTWTFTKFKDVLTEADNDCYNVVFIGPTGCGKSTLINNMFNLTIANAAASAESVTRRVEFKEGKTIMGSNGGNGEQYVQRINVIDTLGFCDSVFTADEVRDMIKSSLELNLAKIDKVLIVCSGRIEQQHVVAIRQFMNWLTYSKNKTRFCFIYNKSDGLTDGEKVTCLLKMCEMLGADSTDKSHVFMNKGNQRIAIKQNINLGFPPQAELEEIKPDLDKLLQAASAHNPKEDRISLDKSACTIL